MLKSLIASFHSAPRDDRGSRDGRRASADGAMMYVWPGRAVQDGFPRATNVRAASMYRPLQWSIELQANMGIRAHPRLTSGKTSLGHHGTQSHGCVGQTVRPSHHSISQALAGEAVDPKLLGLMFDVREIT